MQENLWAATALTWTPLGKLTVHPRPPSLWEGNWLLLPKNSVPVLDLSGLGLRPLRSRCWPPVHFFTIVPSTHTHTRSYQWWSRRTWHRTSSVWKPRRRWRVLCSRRNCRRRFGRRVSAENQWRTENGDARKTAILADNRYLRAPFARPLAVDRITSGLLKAIAVASLPIYL